MASYVAGPGHDVVQLQPPGRSAAAARVERPGAAPLVALPDGAAHRGGHRLARACPAVARRRYGTAVPMVSGPFMSL